MKKALLTTIVLISTFSATAQGNLEIDTCLYPFYHGVASGDPLEDRVIIWTRVTPDSLGTGPVVVSYKMATDTGMTNIVATGSALTDDTKDYTIKFDVTGLNPAEFYYYEFTALGYRSPVGRTRTAPSATVGGDSLRFGLVSCANLEAGFFNVYKVMNERNDLDAVLMLGDYVYEYETGGYSPNPSTQRFWEPSTEMTTLADYRMRYSSYRLDNDLKRSHQLYPWICIWDDHESTNDSWKNGAENHTEGAEGAWVDRKGYSKQAYFEWLPIRETGIGDPHQIYRSLDYGPLCNLVMLDTRLHGRDEQDGTTGSNVTSQFRELLGQDQRDWMQDEVAYSTAKWQIIVQQVMMAPLEVAGIGVNGDQWDGYPSERQKFYDHLTNNSIDNVVVVTGDIHTSWANDLPGGSYNSGTGAGSMGVEFVTPSVTSPGFPIGVGASVVQLANPHMKFVDLDDHGYVILDLNEDRAQADWFFVNTIDTEDNGYSHAASFYTNDGDNHLTSSISASIPSDVLTDAIQPDLCPRTTADIDTNTNASIKSNLITVLSIYPNPTQEFFMIQYYIKESGSLSLEIVDLKGSVAKSFITEKTEGIWVERYPVDDLTAGTYFIRISTPSGSTTQRLVIH
jgi:alkaline phosphatase D